MEIDSPRTGVLWVLRTVPCRAWSQQKLRDTTDGPVLFGPWQINKIHFTNSTVDILEWYPRKECLDCFCFSLLVCFSLAVLVKHQRRQIGEGEKLALSKVSQKGDRQTNHLSGYFKVARLGTIALERVERSSFCSFNILHCGPLTSLLQLIFIASSAPTYSVFLHLFPFTPGTCVSRFWATSRLGLCLITASFS